MIRRPPRSTPFPTRRSSDLRHLRAARAEARPRPWLAEDGVHDRSEEHTSELQSRLHLVCRLLLEKKKISTAIQLSSDMLITTHMLENMVIMPKTIYSS